MSQVLSELEALSLSFRTSLDSFSCGVSLGLGEGGTRFWVMLFCQKRFKSFHGARTAKGTPKPGAVWSCSEAILPESSAAPLLSNST